MVVVLQAPGGARRYSLLETIRQYGHEKLQQAGEESWCLQQHLDYFLHFAETGDRKLRGPEALEWLHRMDEEYSNLRAALEWSFGAGRLWKPVYGCSTRGEYWNRRNITGISPGLKKRWSKAAPPREPRPGLRLSQIYGTFVISFVGMGRRSTLAGGKPGNLASTGRAYRTDYAYVLIWLGYFLNSRDQPQTARHYLQEAMDIFREAGDWWGLGWALNFFAEVKFYDGDVETAFALAKEGVAAFRESGDHYGVAICLHDQGIITTGRASTWKRGIPGKSFGNIQEYGAKYLPYRSDHLGEAARGLNEYEKAEAYYRESLSMRRKWMGPARFIAVHI